MTARRLARLKRRRDRLHRRLANRLLIASQAGAELDRLVGLVRTWLTAAGVPTFDEAEPETIDDLIDEMVDDLLDHDASLRSLALRFGARSVLFGLSSLARTPDGSLLERRLDWLDARIAEASAED